MSAWIVTKEHIDVVVTALKPSSQCKGDQLGRVLWMENVLSVAYRYPQDTGHGDRPGPIDFVDSDVEEYVWSPTIVPSSWVNSAVRCLDYQSCEHPGWESSLAKKLCDLLEAQHPATDAEFRVAPWGIDARVLAGEAVAS